MSRKHRTGAAGKGRPTPSRSSPVARSKPGRAGAARTAKGTVYRQRRFAPLPAAYKAGMLVFWLAALVLVIVLIDGVTAQIGIMLVVTAILPLFVVLVRDPSRRTRR